MKKIYNRSNTDIKESETKCGSDKIQPCLRCGRHFIGKGPHNRICGRCSSINEKIRMGTYSANLEAAILKNYTEDHFYGHIDTKFSMIQNT